MFFLNVPLFLEKRRDVFMFFSGAFHGKTGLLKIPNLRYCIRNNND